MLYSERKRLRQLEDREAAGEDVWTTRLDAPVRRKLWYAIEGCSGADEYRQHEVLEAVRSAVMHSLGLPYLFESYLHAGQDLEGAVLNNDVDFVMSVLEACQRAFAVDPYRYGTKPDLLQERVNEIFRSHRVAFELVEGSIVPFESQELHRAVVAPTLRLLSGRAGWKAVEQAYQNALKEIGDDAADAITDAGTALQQALVVRGCEGNALGPLLKDAKRKGILAPHDSTLGDAIGKVVDWVSADRSEKGDGHNSETGATADDAWFAVHVVGALILRLARGDDRSSAAAGQAV